MKLAVLGVGLIGGSIALAARDRLRATVTGFDQSKEVLRTAEARGLADHCTGSLQEAVSDADAVFVAVPVGELGDVIAAALAAAPVECVVSDVGSTKRQIVAGQDDPRFVGGHPLAGAENSGAEHARADLFDHATWYLTPTANTSGVLYERLHRMLHGLGANPVAIDADTHDAILATVSHLPHVLANILVARAAETLAGEERLPATGPSFRDATRVAGAPSTIWTDIYLSNAQALGDEIERTVEHLTRFRSALERADAEAITAWNDAAAAHRKALLEAQLAGGALTELRVSVPNRPGVVAELALELGRGGVNITDMALYPAPDMSEGVVALWIAGEEPARRAAELISTRGFPVVSA